MLQYTIPQVYWTAIIFPFNSHFHTIVETSVKRTLSITLATQASLADLSDRDRAVQKVHRDSWGVFSTGDVEMW